jgi:hypothetical protein
MGLGGLKFKLADSTADRGPGTRFFFQFPYFTVRLSRLGAARSAPHHARLLAPSVAAAFGRSTADDAASGRAGASGARAVASFLSMRVCHRHGSAESHAPLAARLLLKFLFDRPGSLKWHVPPMVSRVIQALQSLNKNKSKRNRHQTLRVL